MTRNHLWRILPCAVVGLVALHGHALLPAILVQPIQPMIAPAIVTPNLEQKLTVPGLKPVMLAAEAPGGAAIPEPPMDGAELTDRAGHVHQIEERESRALDPAIFTALSPVTVDETPVKLPADQRLH